MTQVDDLSLYFVLPDGSSQENCSQELRSAYNVVTQYGGNAKFVSPEYCLEHNPGKNDVFVFDEFKGDVFEQLKQNSAKYVYVN